MASSQLANQNATTVGGGVDNLHVGFPTVVHSSNCILIGPLQRKPSESCEKDVKKLSQINQKLCPRGNGRTRNTVKIHYFGMFFFSGICPATIFLDFH